MGYSISIRGLSTLAAVTSGHRDLLRAVSEEHRNRTRAVPARLGEPAPRPSSSMRLLSPALDADRDRR